MANYHDPDYLGWQNVTLTKGAHIAGSNQFCFAESVLNEGYLQHGDGFDGGGVSLVLRQMGQRINDAVSDVVRQTLKTSIVDVMNSTNADNDLEIRRSNSIMTDMVRVFAPAWLDFTGYPQYATQLRNTNPITDVASANSARTALRTAHLVLKQAVSTKQAVVGLPTEYGYRPYEAVISSAGQGFMLASELLPEVLIRYSDQYLGNVDETTALVNVFGANADGTGGWFDTIGLLAVSSFRTAIQIT